MADMMTDVMTDVMTGVMTDVTDVMTDVMTDMTRCCPADFLMTDFLPPLSLSTCSISKARMTLMLSWLSS